jgi:hypothetical protein
VVVFFFPIEATLYLCSTKGTMADRNQNNLDFTPPINIDYLNTPRRISKETLDIIVEGSKHNPDLSPFVEESEKKKGKKKKKHHEQ